MISLFCILYVNVILIILINEICIFYYNKSYKQTMKLVEIFPRNYSFLLAISRLTDKMHKGGALRIPFMAMN